MRPVYLRILSLTRLSLVQRGMSLGTGLRFQGDVSLEAAGRG